jgi:hypothetical protein
MEKALMEEAAAVEVVAATLMNTVVVAVELLDKYCFT